MRAEIFQDHHIALLERQAENVVEAGEEDLGISRGLHCHRGNQATHAHRADDGGDFQLSSGSIPILARLAGHARSVESSALRRRFHQKIEAVRDRSSAVALQRGKPELVRFRVPPAGMERLFYPEAELAKDLPKVMRAHLDPSQYLELRPRIAQVEAKLRQQDGPDGFPWTRGFGPERYTPNCSARCRSVP